ncbi:DUF6544 family protein [Guggenheimella bovis]
MKPKKRILPILLKSLLLFLIAVIVWFLVPYSPMKKTYQEDVNKITSKQTQRGMKLYKKEDFEKLPEPLQRYIEQAGFIGTQDINFFTLHFKDADFIMDKDKPKLTIDYKQTNILEGHTRIARIDTRMFGIPFEGYDTFIEGKGGMKGVIAKLITLFDEKGPEMDQACLVTYLAESFLSPSFLLDDSIQYEVIDDKQVKATITHGNLKASGIFTLNENDEIIRFTTNDRSVAKGDGTYEMIPWVTEIGEYKFTTSGIKQPTKFKAIWKYPEGELVYFDSAIEAINYDYQLVIE